MVGGRAGRAPQSSYAAAGARTAGQTLERSRATAAATLRACPEKSGMFLAIRYV